MNSVIYDLFVSPQFKYKTVYRISTGLILGLEVLF